MKCFRFAPSFYFLLLAPLAFAAAPPDKLPSKAPSSRKPASAAEASDQTATASSSSPSSAPELIEPPSAPVTRAAIDTTELNTKLAEIENKISATKSQIGIMKNSDFLINLYFNWADLLAEKSRVLYTIKTGTNPNTPESEMDFTKEKRPKLEAIEIYTKIYTFFPKSNLRDRALFYRAHEQGDVGDYTSMIQTYGQLVREFPDSKYWNESQILLGDYLMEQKKDVDGALMHYQAIIAKPVNLFTSVAYYRAGWCQVNKLSYPESFKAFEKAIDTNMVTDAEVLPEVYKRTDVRKEAVIALVIPFVELYAEHSPLIKVQQNQLTSYFLQHSDSFSTYIKALGKLDRRFQLKNLWQESADVNAELIAISPDPAVRGEAIVQFYQAFKKAKIKFDSLKFLTAVGEVAQAVSLNDKLGTKERSQAQKRFEIVARDVATSADKTARTTKMVADYSQAAEAYSIYRWIFPESPHLAKMQVNQAESLFNSQRNNDAGVAYEQLQRLAIKNTKSKGFDESAIEAYIKSLQNPDKLSPVELLQARRGLRQQGTQWLAKNKNNPGAATVQFNIALSLYEEKEFNPAIKSFRKFIADHGKDPRVRDSIMLIINSYSQNDDNVGLSKVGPQLLSVASLNDGDRGQIREAIHSAQRKQLQAVAGEFGTKEYIQKLRSIASLQKGTELGDQALAEAFEALKSKRDMTAYSVGEELVTRFSDSNYTKNVVASMAQMAMTTADFGRAASFFETYAKKYPKEKESHDWLKSAADIREWLGDYDGSRNDRIKLGEAEAAARMDFLGSNWASLEKTSTRVNGLMATYWGALAHYRQGHADQANSLLTKVAHSHGANAEERDAVAHASFLLSSRSLQNFKAIKMKDANDAQALKNKVAGYKTLETELQSVAAMGSGRWTIAALYGLGQANHEIANFMLSAPVPAGLTPDQMKEYKAAIDGQANPFAAKSKKYFDTCLSTAEKFEVFTRFVNGCLGRGKEEVNEAEDSKIQTKAANTDPPGAVNIRLKLFDKPRDTGMLQTLAETYMRAGDYAMANAVLSRSLEVDPENAKTIASLGVTYLYMNELDRAHDELKKALDKNASEPTAVWHMAALYHEFSFNKKYSSLHARALKTGKPNLVHPFLKKII